MDTINGIFAEAGVYASDVEDYAKAQIKMICDNETSLGSCRTATPEKSARSGLP